MATITSEMKVGEIVRNWPQTMQVFRSHGLNLRCGEPIPSLLPPPSMGSIWTHSWQS